MKLVNLFKFSCFIIDLEQQSTLTADVDSFDLCGLNFWIGIIKCELKIKYCENSVSRMMIEHNR